MLKQSYGILLSIIVHIAIFIIPFSFSVPQDTEKTGKELKLIAITQTVPEEPQGKEKNNKCQCSNCDCNKQEVSSQQPKLQAIATLKKPEKRSVKLKEKQVKSQKEHVKPEEKPVKSEVIKKTIEPRKKLKPKKRIQQKQKKQTHSVKKISPINELHRTKKEPESAEKWKSKESKWVKTLPDINDSAEKNNFYISAAHKGKSGDQKSQEKRQKSNRQGTKEKSENKAEVVAKKSSVEREFGFHEGPAFLHQSLPKYPRQAKRRGKEGVVILKLTIDEKGRLTNVQVIQDPGYGLAQAAIEAVKKSTFTPAKDKGQPVTCRCLLPIKFVLR